MIGVFSGTSTFCVNSFALYFFAILTLSKKMRTSMQPLFTAVDSEFDSVRFVLTDMDETLTYQGRLAAATYTALERLQTHGIRVIPVTAAPAGWCDQMARMWPVDGVIGENGGFFSSAQRVCMSCVGTSGTPKPSKAGYRVACRPSLGRSSPGCPKRYWPAISRSG